jgi:hypothetical protein
VNDILITSAKLTPVIKADEDVAQEKKDPDEKPSLSSIKPISIPKSGGINTDNNINIVEKYSSTQKSSTLSSTQKSFDSSSAKSVSKKK